MDRQNNTHQKLSGGGINELTKFSTLKGIGSLISDIDYNNITNNKLIFNGPEFIINQTLLNLSDNIYCSNIYFNSNLFYYKKDIDNKFQNILIPKLGINITDNKNISVRFSDGGWSSNNTTNLLYTLSRNIGIGTSNPLSTLHIKHANAKLTIDNNANKFNFYNYNNDFILGYDDIKQIKINKFANSNSLYIDNYSTVNISNIAINGITYLTSNFYVNNQHIIDWLVKDKNIATENYVNTRSYLSDETILYGYGGNITNLDYKQITLNKLIFDLPLIYNEDDNTVRTDVSYFGWTSNSNIIYSSFKSKIGIGTSNPLATLHIGTTEYNITDINNYNNNGTLIISKIENIYNINKNFKFGYDDNYNFSFGDFSIFNDGTTIWKKQFYINNLAPEGSFIINEIGNINIKNSLNIYSNLIINNGNIIFNNQVKFNIDNNNNFLIDNNIIINNKTNTIGIGTNPDDNYNLLINGDVKILSDFYTNNINVSNNINVLNLNSSNINVSNINTTSLSSTNINNANLIRSQQINATVIISSNNIITSNINTSNLICSNNILCSNNLNVIRTITANSINASNAIINNTLISRFISITSNLTVSSNINTNNLTVLSNINANNILSINIKTNNINVTDNIFANIINSSYINNLNNISTNDIFSSNITTCNINSLNINAKDITVSDNIIANNINTSYIINNNKITTTDLDVRNSINCIISIKSPLFNTNNIYISDKIGINTSAPISELQICNKTSSENTSLTITKNNNNFRIGYDLNNIFCLGSYNTISKNWNKQILINNNAPNNIIIVKNSGNISIGTEPSNTNDLYKLNVIGNLNAINIYENGVKILNNNTVNDIINTSLQSYLTIENANTLFSTRYFVETSINTNITYIEDLIISLLSTTSNVYTSIKKYPFGNIYDINNNLQFTPSSLEYFENNNIYGLNEYFSENIINKDNSIDTYIYNIYYSSSLLQTVFYILNKNLLFSYSDTYTSLNSISWGVLNYNIYYKNTTQNLIDLNRNKIITYGVTSEINKYYGDFIIIKYEFDFILTKYIFYATNTIENYKIPNAPSLWRCYGSNDAEIWTIINAASNDINPIVDSSYIDTNNGYGYYEKNFDNIISYRYIGFVFSKIIAFNKFNFQGFDGLDRALELFKIELFGRKIIQPIYVSSNVLFNTLTNYVKNDYIKNFVENRYTVVSPLELNGNILSFNSDFLNNESTNGLYELITNYINLKTDIWKKIINTSIIYYIGDTIGIGTSNPNPNLDPDLRLNVYGSIITSNITNYGYLNNFGRIDVNGNITANKYYGDGAFITNINYNNISIISKPDLTNLNNWIRHINNLSDGLSNCYNNFNGNTGIGFIIGEYLYSKLSVKGNIYSTGIINAITGLQENFINISDKYLSLNGGIISGSIGIGTNISPIHKVIINGSLNATSLEINNNLFSLNLISSNITALRQISTSNLISSNLTVLYQISTSNLIALNISTLNQISSSNLISSNITALRQISTSNLNALNINALNQISTSNLISSNINALNQILTPNLISSNITALNQISTSNLISSNINALNQISTSNLTILNQILTPNLISSNITILNQISTSNLISFNITALHQISTSNLISSNITALNQITTSNLISSNITALNQISTPNLISSNITALQQISTSNLISSNITALRQILTSNLISSNINALNQILTPNIVSSNITALNQILTPNIVSSNITILNQISTSNLISSNITTLNEISTSNLISSNITILNEISTSNLISSNINALNHILTLNLVSSNITALRQISTSNLVASNITSLRQISTSNLVASNITALRQISTSNLVSSNINVNNLSSYSIFAANNISIGDNPSVMYKLHVNGSIYSSNDIISDGNIKEGGIYLKDKYLSINSSTPGTSIINTETLKNELSNNHPNIQKKYGFRCICSNEIILNNKTYYKHDIDLSLYIKSKVDSIDENPYRIFGIKCFSTSAIFNNNILNKPPNILQYDIYTSFILSTNNINICAIGFPSNYYLNKITAGDIFILKTTNYNYISILSKIPNLSISCIISDFLF
jgi:hypothetical protein